MFKEGFVHFVLHDASIFVYLIFLTSIVGIALIASRIHALWVKHSVDYASVTAQLAGMVEGGSYRQALQLCSSGKDPMTAILKEALTRANRPEREIRRGLEAASMEEMQRFKGSTHMLPHISNIATLLGLLGTIRGLITSFSGLSSGDAAQRTEMLSRGVSEAFTATFFGILLATITIAAYLIVSNRQGKLSARIEHGVATVTDTILSRQAEIRASEANTGVV